MYNQICLGKIDLVIHLISSMFTNKVPSKLNKTPLIAPLVFMRHKHKQTEI